MPEGARIRDGARFKDGELEEMELKSALPRRGVGGGEGGGESPSCWKPRWLLIILFTPLSSLAGASTPFLAALSTPYSIPFFVPALTPFSMPFSASELSPLAPALDRALLAAELTTLVIGDSGSTSLKGIRLSGAVATRAAASSLVISPLCRRWAASAALAATLIGPVTGADSPPVPSSTTLATWLTSVPGWVATSCSQRPRSYLSVLVGCMCSRSASVRESRYVVRPHKRCAIAAAKRL